MISQIGTVEKTARKLIFGGEGARPLHPLDPPLKKQRKKFHLVTDAPTDIIIFLGMPVLCGMLWPTTPYLGKIWNRVKKTRKKYIAKTGI